MFQNLGAFSITRVDYSYERRNEFQSTALPIKFGDAHFGHQCMNIVKDVGFYAGQTPLFSMKIRLKGLAMEIPS
jgi:hypothetical protein